MIYNQEIGEAWNTERNTKKSERYVSGTPNTPEKKARFKAMNKMIDKKMGKNGFTVDYVKQALLTLDYDEVVSLIKKDYSMGEALKRVIDNTDLSSFTPKGGDRYDVKDEIQVKRELMRIKNRSGKYADMSDEDLAKAKNSWENY